MQGLLFAALIEYPAMNYTQSFNELKSIFNPEINNTQVAWSGVRIHNILFRSDPSTDIFVSSQDLMINENCSFSYPVFEPPRPSNRVILLLHGLNERSWIKYLAWGHWLSENTNSYVVLFPISFHINRSPESWKDPRSMVPYVQNRNAEIGNTDMLSFANVALSNRLTEDPLRFFVSGHQTVNDIVKLLNKIRNGEHEIIPGGAHLDVFAYSIGAFLAEILMLADPEKLFTESRLFIFCGGSVFSNMNGTSKLIMDSYAFKKVYDFYLRDFEETINIRNRISDFLKSTSLGLAFRSMIDLGRLKSFREQIFRKLKDQIQCSVLQKDTVIPVKGIVETLQETERRDLVKIHDFSYHYSHENPFPVFSDERHLEVDRCFSLVFNEARIFLAS
jgi:hypothetical protein